MTKILVICIILLLYKEKWAHADSSSNSSPGFSTFDTSSSLGTYSSSTSKPSSSTLGTSSSLGTYIPSTSKPNYSTFGTSSSPYTYSSSNSSPGFSTFETSSSLGTYSSSNSIPSSYTFEKFSSLGTHSSSKSTPSVSRSSGYGSFYTGRYSTISSAKTQTWSYFTYDSCISPSESHSQSSSSILSVLFSSPKYTGLSSSLSTEPQTYSPISITTTESPSVSSVCKPETCGSSSGSLPYPSYITPADPSHDSSSSSSTVPPPYPSYSSSSSFISYSSSSSASSSSSSSSSEVDTCNCGSIRKPRSCLEVKQRGYNTSGVYKIAPCECRPCDVVSVYCDMDTDGGGWTVFQNRGKNISLDFKRDFRSYRYGFGNAEKDFWLGNEYIHCLTSQTYSELKVIMGDWCKKTLEEYYSCFFVADWNSRFELRLKKFTSNSSTDSLMPHSHVKFSTHDRDTGNRRATQLGSGWWHTAPHSNLNGVYRSKEDSKHCCRQRNSLMTKNQSKQSCKIDGIFWKKWHGITYSLKATTMMLRGRSSQDNPSAAALECLDIDKDLPCQKKQHISAITYGI